MVSESVDRKWLMVMSNQLWFASNWLVSKPLCIKMTCLYLDSHTTQPRVQTWCILSIRCKTYHQWEKNTGASFFLERDVFHLWGTKKNFWVLRGIKPQTFGFSAPMFHHWATETLWWARPITKVLHYELSLDITLRCFVWMRDHKSCHSILIDC